MKDIKEGRSSKVVKFSRKKSTAKSKVMNILEFVVAFAAVIVAAHCYHKITFYNSYDWGSLEGKVFLNLESDVSTLYKGECITEEQMRRYRDAVNNIYAISLSGGEISSQVLKDYNDMIKETSFLNYEYCSFSSTGKKFARGLGDRIRFKVYIEIVEYYRELIPEEKYNSLQVIKNQTWSEYGEEYIKKVIDFAKKLVREYVVGKRTDEVPSEYERFFNVTFD